MANIIQAVTKGRPFGYLEDDFKVVSALVFKKLPWTSANQQSSTGIINEGLWGIAAQCWKQKPASRLTIAQIQEKLRGLRVLNESGTGTSINSMYTIYTYM